MKTKSKLIGSIEDDKNYTLTENSALTLKSSKSDLTDMFGLGGAFRTRSDEDVEALFRKAYAEDELLAVKCLFYLRDVRGGQGERRFFKVCLKWLSNNHPEIIKKNFENIPEYGRWDDVFSLMDTETESEVLDFYGKQIKEDVKKLETESQTISLAGKWAKSENSSSEETKRYGSKLRRSLGLTSRQYRKMLSGLRARIDIVEKKICAKKWEEIDFSKVPSNAMSKLRKAFAKHTPEKFKEFLEKVEEGETKINSGTLYPYEITSKAAHASGSTEARTLDAQWKALPDYMADSDKRVICVVDVSGSMTWTGVNGVLPIDVAVSLGIYCADKGKGIFKDSFLTFTDECDLEVIKGTNIVEKSQNLRQAKWGGSTNLQSAFNTILNAGLKEGLGEEDMPNVIFVITDLEFNPSSSGTTNQKEIEEKYREAGYEVPTLVWWNVNAKNSQSPVTHDEEGNMLVSGFSPSILETVLTGKSTTPYDLMVEKLSSDRYDKITV